MQDSAELPQSDVKGYAVEQVWFAAEAWPLRAAQEQRSALVFGALAQAARAAGVAREWTVQFASAARDEMCHMQLCTYVGAALGATRPIRDLRPVRERVRSLEDPSLRAMTLALVEVAIGETLSCGLFEVGTARAREPLTKAALAMIAADEARHARLGWSAVEDLWPLLGAPRSAEIARQVSRDLGALEQEIAAPALRRLDSGEAFDPAWAALGVLSPQARVDSFYASLEQHVLPRLEVIGVDAERAWKDRYRVQ